MGYRKWGIEVIWSVITHVTGIILCFQSWGIFLQKGENILSGGKYAHLFKGEGGKWCHFKVFSDEEGAEYRPL